MVKAWVLAPYYILLYRESFFFLEKNWTILHRGSLITFWREDQHKTIFFLINLHTCKSNR